MTSLARFEIDLAPPFPAATSQSSGSRADSIPASSYPRVRRRRPVRPDAQPTHGPGGFTDSTLVRVLERGRGDVRTRCPTPWLQLHCDSGTGSGSVFAGRQASVQEERTPPLEPIAWRIPSLPAVKATMRGSDPCGLSYSPRQARPNGQTSVAIPCPCPIHRATRGQRDKRPPPAAPTSNLTRSPPTKRCPFHAENVHGAGMAVRAGA